MIFSIDILAKTHKLITIPRISKQRGRYLSGIQGLKSASAEVLKEGPHYRDLKEESDEFFSEEYLRIPFNLNL